MIPLKSEKDLEMMRIAGKIVAKIMNKIQGAIKEGISTAQVDSYAEELIFDANVLPAFKGYNGFPATTCISVNEEIVHGIPSEEKKLKNGDIVSLDLGINYEGYFSDMAVTVGIGKVDAKLKKLMEVAKEALTAGIKQAKINNRLYDISYAVQNYVEEHGFSVVRQFVGHGIGRMLHESPEIPNFGQKNEGPAIKAGMVFAIEPMINMGTWEAKITDNGWTAVTTDGLPSAHFEHTIAITEKGPEILTH